MEILEQVDVGIKFNRVWAMPSHHTFTIKPITELLERYVLDGLGWIDPFSGGNSPAEVTNDLNPNSPTKFHLDAKDFLNQLPGLYKGCLFDPPYSPRQIKEMYEAIGIKNSFQNTMATFWSEKKNIAATKIQPGGYVICCGWNTTGFGKGRGFELVEILLVCHGGAHNDTIVTVEIKAS